MLLAVGDGKLVQQNYDPRVTAVGSAAEVDQWRGTSTSCSCCY